MQETFIEKDCRDFALAPSTQLQHHLQLRLLNLLRKIIFSCEKYIFKKKYFFLGLPRLATCIFSFFYNEPELGKGIDPDMGLTPFPSSILN